jgi:hypothetical protein
MKIPKSRKKHAKTSLKYLRDAFKLQKDLEKKAWRELRNVK